MDSLQDILAKRDFTKPESIDFIQNYVYEKYGAKVTVIENEKNILVKTGNSSLSSMIHMERINLQRLIGTKKSIIVRAT